MAHEGKRPCCLGYKIKCRFCPADHFQSRFNRDRHEEYSCEQNPNRKTAKCRYCEKTLGTAEAKRKHEDQHCPAKKPRGSV